MARQKSPTERGENIFQVLRPAIIAQYSTDDCTRKMRQFLIEFYARIIILYLFIIPFINVKLATDRFSWRWIRYVPTLIPMSLSHNNYINFTALSIVYNKNACHCQKKKRNVPTRDKRHIDFYTCAARVRFCCKDSSSFSRWVDFSSAEQRRDIRTSHGNKERQFLTHAPCIFLLNCCENSLNFRCGALRKRYNRARSRSPITFVLQLFYIRK